MNSNEKIYRPKFNVSLVLAFITFILLVISISLNANIYAKYKSADGSSDGARVASFSIGSDFDKANIGTSFAIKPVDGSNVQNYQIEIKNSSEVAVEYQLVIKSTGNYPLEYDIKIGAISLETTGLPDDAFGTVGVHDIAINGTDIVSLVITWPETENDYHYSTEVELIEIELVVNQVD